MEESPGKPGTVPGAADLDFRDVDAVDERKAFLLSIGEGEKSRIYQTADGGIPGPSASSTTIPGASSMPLPFGMPIMGSPWATRSTDDSRS